MYISETIALNGKEGLMNIHDNTAIERQVRELEDLWHHGYFYETLHEFLGLTWDQFKIYSEKEELPDSYLPPHF